MFCPEGYETLATAYRRCGQAAAEWAKSQPAIEKPKYPGLFIDSGMDEEFRRGGYREWLWMHFARHTFNQLYCVSASGVILRLDVESGGYLTICPNEFPEDIKIKRDSMNWLETFIFGSTIRPSLFEHYQLG